MLVCEIQNGIHGIRGFFATPEWFREIFIKLCRMSPKILTSSPEQFKKNSPGTA